MSELVIRIPDGSFFANVSITEGNSINKKTVSLEDLILQLSSGFTINTGILPRGTRFFSGTKNHYSVGIEVPASKRQVLYQKWGSEIKETLPFPPLLFLFEVKEKKLYSSFCFSLKAPFTTIKDQIYRFPFGNTYYDGRICWGSVVLPPIKTTYDLMSCISSFIDSNYNGDLFDSNTYNKITSFEKLIKQLSSLETFPTEDLIKMNKNINEILITKGI